MRRVHGALFLAVAVLTAVPSVALATHSPGRGPNHDLATGTGTVFFQIPSGPVRQDHHVNAKSGPLGESPRGHFFIHSGGTVDIRGDVTCLRVIGNRAGVGGVVRRSNAPTIPPGTVYVLTVIDNGEGQAVPDQISPDRGTSPNECPPRMAGLPITHGNFVVHNATP